MVKVGSLIIPRFVMLLVWIVLVILVIILLAWIIHLIGGGSFDLRLGHFSLHLGVT